MKTLNHASIGVCFRFLEDRKPEVLVVKYFNEEEQTEVRFPSGSVQFRDIYKSAEMYIERKMMTNVKDPIFWLLGKILDSEKEFYEKVKLYKSRHEKNQFFDSILSDILNELLKCYLLDEDFDFIIENCRRLTLEREIREETDAFEFGEFVSCSNSIFGNHMRCCYVTTQTKAPDSYAGSGDADIASSNWEPVENMLEKVSPKHLNYFLSAIKVAIEQNIHPRVGELAVYCTATNY